MGSEEFDTEAEAVAGAVEDVDVDERIAAACRGSGNPAALAWLAEGLGLRPGMRVADLGAGLCGPAAWLDRHYGCAVIGADPAAGAAHGASTLFDVPVLRSTAAAAPFRSGAFDATVVLGVLSVVDDPAAVLTEAARLAPLVGVLEWCSTEAGAVTAGGSRFPTPDELAAMIDGAGWQRTQSVDLDVPVPARWVEAAARADVGTSPDEAEVSEAVDAGRLRVRLAVAGR